MDLRNEIYVETGFAHPTSRACPPPRSSGWRKPTGQQVFDNFHSCGHVSGNMEG